VRTLHEAGATDAYLYGAPGTPGATGNLGHLHAFFLLTARPEVYNLPTAPSRGAERVLPSLIAGLATAIVLTAAAFGFLAAASWGETTMDASTQPASPQFPILASGAEPIPTYHGRPALKPSLYGWIVAFYIFIGGLAGAAQIIATAADLLGTRGGAVILVGRVVALPGAIFGGILLIVDLHTKRRFYNMLRIFRATSPMSIGTYMLMSFGF